jgi:SynChlorMet cassette protein ScmD
MDETEEENAIANPLIVLREEFDDWAILFDPDTGNTFGLNPLGVLIWKQLDSHHTLDDIVQQIREAAKDVPADVAGHVRTFLQNAVRLGLVGYGEQRG